MRNAEIADAFGELADRLAIIDPKPYRWMAYRRAESTFRDLGESIAVLSEERRLGEIDGVGRAIEEKVRELLATGTFPALERAREDVPDALLELTRLPGVGPATAKKVHAATDGESFESLMERAATGSLSPGDGVPKKVVEALASAYEQHAAGAPEQPGARSGIPIGVDGEPLPGPWFRRDQVLAAHEALAELLPSQVRNLRASGAYARGAELMREATLVAEADDPVAAAAACAQCLAARGWELPDADVPRLEVLDGVPVEHVADLQLTSPAGMPVEIALAEPGHAERAAHRLAGPVAWVLREPEPPTDGSPQVAWELRERVLSGALSTEALPDDLVTAADLRGELHAHSDWSDGRAPIIDMARAARARGDEFFAITDHSAPYAMVNGLDPARLQAQADEVARVNEQLQREHEEQGLPRFQVLRGSELEILPDGTLGLPDAALEQLDWVVASIHVQQRQAADVILDRMRRVVENPLVDAIGHPTSRRLLVRDRTQLDVERLVELAVDADVVLEINANPDRLDLDSEHAALALAAGARLTVNTDAHRPATLALRDHGVAVARRAGARVRDVVNCLPPEQLLAGRRRHR